MSTSELKISVVIPTYNSAHTLEATITSCLNQTLHPYEILVCDDGSTDNSKEVVEALQDPRVIWIPGTHSGTPAVPRNLGLKRAHGEWIAFCDSDDQWLPTKIEKQISLTKRLDCKAVSTNAVLKINNVITNIQASSWRKEELSFKNLLRTNNIICSSAMIHSSVFNEIGGFPEELEYRSFEDYIYWLRVTTKTNFAYINESLVIYDDHPETSLRSTFKDGRLLKEKTLRNFINWAKEHRLYFFIVQAQMSLLEGWVKKNLSDIIKICYKR
jgi:teichuronic acid biosynthesis glycosyltransferase TuaG